MEISPSLADIQRQTVGEVRSHQSKFRVECRDAVDPSGWGMFLLFPLLFHHCFQVFSLINLGCLMILPRGFYSSLSAVNDTLVCGVSITLDVLNG